MFVDVLFFLLALWSGSSSGEMEVISIGRSSRASSSLHELIVFFITLCVPGLESARFTVVGPGHPVTAVVGEDVVLPCHLSPRMSAENMEVRWFQHEFLSFVHLYRHGKEEFGQQMPKYHGRTELSKAGITDGNVALKIVNVRPSDEGQYRCFVQGEVFHEEAVLELKVTASGSIPQISVEGYQDGGIRMVCHLAGWYPEPEVLWRDLSGQLLSSSAETKSRDTQGLFEIKSSLVVTERSNQNVSCSVRSARFSLEKDPSTFYMSEFFFPRASPWMVVWSVTLVILLVFIGLILFLRKLRGEHLDLISKLQRELEWRRSLSDSANMTLDPDTAHPQLIVSEDGKCVRWERTRQPPPNTPERFDTEFCVLGREGFTSGTHYWEVEVGDGRYWGVGVARESVSRKGWVSRSSDGGVWAVQWGWDQFWALTDPVTALPVGQAPSRIQVFLDCDARQVTFIDAGSEAPIFTFPPGSLPEERIRPWLSVWGTDTQLALCT